VPGVQRRVDYCATGVDILIHVSRPVVIILLSLLTAVSTADAAPVRVRLQEGNARAFLVLRSADAEEIAFGELRQKPMGGGLIESRLELNFKDGSRREELAVFSQWQVFRLERYRLVQRGPSFPTLEASFDRCAEATTRRRNCSRGFGEARGRTARDARRLVQRATDDPCEESVASATGSSPVTSRHSRSSKARCS